MENIKHIYSMGTSGFGKGNTTSVAEFNVYVDAETVDRIYTVETGCKGTVYSII